MSFPIQCIDASQIRQFLRVATLRILQRGHSLSILSLIHGSNPWGIKSKISIMTIANNNILNSGQNRKNSSSGNSIKTAPTGPQMVTTPPKTAQITTWNDIDTSRVEGPAIRMKWAYNPPDIPAKKPLRQNAINL